MKFPLDYEVQAVRPDSGAAYADLVHGTERYVVGVEAQPFEVRVTATRYHLAKYQIVRATLQVDGAGIGVSELLSAKRPSANFRGFVSSIKGENHVRQFLFGKAETDSEAPSRAPGSSKTGSLDVNFAAVREIPGHNAPLRGAVGAQQAAALKPVEGKKWFLQPSLSAQQGQVTGPPLTFSTKRYVDVQQLANCTMRMETAAILILRKVLNPDFPTHKAIIDQFRPEDEQEGSSDQNLPPVAASNEVSSNRVGLKRERTAGSPGAHKAIKREPAGVFGKLDADEDECIDLT